MSSGDMFSALLNDPQAMQKIAGLASELMGTSVPGQIQPAPPDSSDERQQRLPAPADTSAYADRWALLCALRPFLSAHTGAQIDHAAHIVSMARMTRGTVGRLLSDKGDDVHV